MSRAHAILLSTALLLLGACNGSAGFTSNALFSESMGKKRHVKLDAKSSLNQLEFKFDRNNPFIRGSNYGAINSTIPKAETPAMAVGVVPPADAPPKVWKRAWKLHRFVMPLLYLFDNTKLPDSYCALMCLWWKALSANDKQSPAFDNSLVFDLLPKGTRQVVGKRLRHFYPRLHHANVEIRTAYLDQQVNNIITEVKQTAPHQKILLVTLGAGYDARSIKFRERGLIDRAVELDLPNVVAAKQAMFHSKRLKKRRPWLTDDLLPTFHPINLNEVDQVKDILTGILIADNATSWHTIFLFEGVMIYLNETVPQRLLETCSAVLSTGHDGSLVFADRLENVPGGDYALGVKELAKTGWDIVDWQPKPGLARHMGRAKLILENYHPT